MTGRRASDIQHGYGAPPSSDELDELKAWEAKFKGEKIAPVLNRIGLELQAAAKAYPAAMRVINNAPKAERERLENLPVVVVARMGTPRTTRPLRNGGVARSSRSRSSRRARAPGRRPDDDPHELVAALAALIAEHGPRSACWLATAVRRRKTDVLASLRSGRFVQSGRGRGSRWDIASPARSFDAEEAATRWNCDVDAATEIIFGQEGFLALGLVSTLNSNGRVFVTEFGLAAAASVEAAR